MRSSAASRRSIVSSSERNSSLEDCAMMYNPFEFHLTDDELRKLGELLLTWSHIEHTIGNCLKAVLKFSDDEAIALIFPLALEHRVRWLRGLPERMNLAARMALDEFALLLPGLQAVRNNGIHGVIINDVEDGPLFHLRSKDRTFTKNDLFSCEEFTNYCAHIALSIRSALFYPDDKDLPSILPERPAIPKVLAEFVQFRKK
jgi:hypothetical protein